MKTLDEFLAYELQLALKDYKRTCKSIRKNIVKKFMIKTLCERVKQQMPGCTTSQGSNCMWVYLSSNHNISKDWMIFLENNIDYISTLGKSKEYKVNLDQSYGSYDYKWGEFTIYVNYNGGKCKRVKIGEKTKTIKEDIYEVQCL